MKSNPICICSYYKECHERLSNAQVHLSIYIYHYLLCIYIYKLKYRIYCCYTFIEPHQWSYYSLIFYLFFSLFKLLFSILKKKKKTLLLTISSQLQLYFLQLSLPSLPLYLLITLDFSVTLLSSFFFLYFDPSSPNIFFFF